MLELVRYISSELKNPMAANALADELFKAIESTKAFPYANPVLVPIRPLKFEYRKLVVKNYLILYRVDESEKVITVTRVLYSKRDYGKLLM